jgi:hypothetical protein
MRTLPSLYPPRLDGPESIALASINGDVTGDVLLFALVENDDFIQPVSKR